MKWKRFKLYYCYFATLDQENAQHFSLDIYIIIPQ